MRVLAGGSDVLLLPSGCWTRSWLLATELPGFGIVTREGREGSTRFVLAAPQFPGRSGDGREGRGARGEPEVRGDPGGARPHGEASRGSTKRAGAQERPGAFWGR